MREKGFEAGGRVPDPAVVLGDVWRDLTGRAGEHGIASLMGHALVLGVMSCVGAVWGVGLNAAFTLWMLASAGILRGALEVADRLGVVTLTPEGALVVLVVGFFGWWFATFGAMAAAMVCFQPVIYTTLAPVHAGWMRAVAKPGDRLDPADVARLAVRDLPSTLLCAAFVSMLTLVLLVTGPGALLPLLLFGFAPSLVAIHRVPWRSALWMSARHVVANPGFHVGYLCGWAALAVVALNVPVFGPAFLVLLHVRVHRVVFGDGPVPVERLAASLAGRLATV